MIKIIITLSLILNLILIYFLNKKKLRKIFTSTKIKTVEITDINEAFKPNKISEKLLSPKDDVFIKSFSIPESFNVVGMTSDYEAWILSVLAKRSNKIFEFGTCSGKTTSLLAVNSPPNAEIFSLTLDKEQSKLIKSEKHDNKYAFRNLKNESLYDKFIFTGKNFEKKIKVIFQDSKKLIVDPYINQFDLIFIDGAHTYSYLKNDSEKAFQMIKKGGYILWHDFNIGKKSCKDVVKYLEESINTKTIYHIKNTSLCFYQKN